MMPGNFNPFERPSRFQNKRPQRKPNPRFKETNFEEKVIEIKRVIKVTKGGRQFRFSALVVVGDRNGKIGYAVAKHIEVPEAIKAAIRQAKRNLYQVSIVGKAATVPHEAIGKSTSSRIMLKPAAEGKGIIASDKVRAVCELAGIRNIYSKSLGSNNPQNVVIATINGLVNMKTKEQFMSLRDKTEL